MTRPSFLLMLNKLSNGGIMAAVTFDQFLAMDALDADRVYTALIQSGDHGRAEEWQRAYYQRNGVNLPLTAEARKEASKPITRDEFVALPKEAAWQKYRQIVNAGRYEEAENLHRSWVDKNGEPLTGSSDASSAPPIVAQPLASGGNGLQAFGWFVLLIGIGLAAASFMYDPSVEITRTEVLPYTGYSYEKTDSVNNTGKLNIQLMMCVFGSALSVVGAIFAAKPKGY